MLWLGPLNYDKDYDLSDNKKPIRLLKVTTIESSESSRVFYCEFSDFPRHPGN